MTRCRVTARGQSAVVALPQKNAYDAYKAAMGDLGHPHFSECSFEWGVAGEPSLGPEKPAEHDEPEACTGRTASCLPLTMRPLECMRLLTEALRNIQADLTRREGEVTELYLEREELLAENERLREELGETTARPLPPNHPFWTDPAHQAPNSALAGVDQRAATTDSK